MASYLTALGLAWTIGVNFVLFLLLAGGLTRVWHGGRFFGPGTTFAPFPVKVAIFLVPVGIVVGTLLFVATGRGDEAVKHFKELSPEERRRRVVAAWTYVGVSFGALAFFLALGYASAS